MTWGEREASILARGPLFTLKTRRPLASSERIKLSRSWPQRFMVELLDIGHAEWLHVASITADLEALIAGPDPIPALVLTTTPACLIRCTMWHFTITLINVSDQPLSFAVDVYGELATQEPLRHRWRN